MSEELENKIEEYIHREYDYETAHKDTLSAVREAFFSQYDASKYHVEYNDSYYSFENEIETTNMIGELEIFIDDADIINEIKSLNDKEREELFDKYCIEGFSDNGFYCYVACNGHWYITENWKNGIDN